MEIINVLEDLIEKSSLFSELTSHRIDRVRSITKFYDVSRTIYRKPAKDFISVLFYGSKPKKNCNNQTKFSKSKEQVKKKKTADRFQVDMLLNLNTFTESLSFRYIYRAD